MANISAQDFFGKGDATATDGGPSNVSASSFFGASNPLDGFAAADKQTRQPGLLDRIGGVVNSLFPGAQIGKALTNSATGLNALAHGDQAGFQSAANENQQNFGRIAGDVGQAALTPLAGIGAGGSVVARAGSQVALGAGLGASNAVAQGNPNVGQAAAVGGIGGGALSLGGDALGAALTQLPQRLVRGALPTLKPGSEMDALAKVKLGSIGKMLDESKASVSNLGRQVNTILEHPEYASHLGEGNAAVQRTLDQFPNSEYTPDHVISTVKTLLPEQAKLIGKIADGTATLLEKNTVRKALDPIIKKVFTDNPQVTSSKQIGAAFANSLRGEVQTQAPETQPVFQKLSQELNLRNALAKTDKKIQNRSAVGLLDILSVMGGGLPAVAGERFARSPAVSLATAKGVQGIADAVGVGKTAKLIDVSKATDLPNKQGGFIHLPERVQSLGLHPEDASVMTKFIDHARTGASLSDGQFAQAEKMAQKLGVSMDKGIKGVAQHFSDILEGIKQPPKGALQARDETGRFSSASRKVPPRSR